VPLREEPVAPRAVKPGRAVVPAPAPRRDVPPAARQVPLGVLEGQPRRGFVARLASLFDVLRVPQPRS
jgi:hypothetical protein